MDNQALNSENDQCGPDHPESDELMRGEGLVKNQDAYDQLKRGSDILQQSHQRQRDALGR